MFEIGDAVLAGEIHATLEGGVNGWLRLAGGASPLLFELHGELPEECQGLRIQFARDLDHPHDDLTAPGKKLSNMQIGVFGKLVINGRFPDDEDTPYLRLTWFGQQGAIGVLLRNPLVATGLHSGGEATLETIDLEVEYPFPSEVLSFPEAPIVDDGPALEQARRNLENCPPGSDMLSNPVDEDEAIVAEEAVRGLMLMDDLITNPRSIELGEVIGVRDPDAPSDEESVAELLRNLIARLATFQIRLSFCEHCSDSDVLDLLFGPMADEIRIEPDLIGSGWITNIDTAEFCPFCESENDDLFEDDPFPDED